MGSLPSTPTNYLGVAQFGRAPDLGSGGRGFKSHYLDHFERREKMWDIDQGIAECRSIVEMLADDLDWDYETQTPSTPDYINVQKKTIERFSQIQEWLEELKELRSEVERLTAKESEVEIENDSE